MRPKRSLGQHFLVDPNLQRKIADAPELRPGDTVVEIGPGRGALTRHLVERAGRLILVELDDELAERLRDVYAGRPGVEVVHADVLEVDLAARVDEPDRLVVVGNIPYNLTTPIIFRLLERPRPREIVLTIQREVAERIVADPGTSEYGALSVGVRSVARAERLFDVSRHAFRPEPNVESSVLRIRPVRPPPLTPSEEEALRTLTRATFQWRRKQLGTTLRKHPRYDLERDELEALAERADLDLRRRPETLSPDEMVELSRLLSGAGREGGREGA